MLESLQVNGLLWIKVVNHTIIWFKNLFKKFGYEFFPINPDASHHNGTVEQSHCTVSQAVKALLFGVGLDFKF